MQYRYLALPLLLAFLTSCTPKEISVPGDFDSLYKAHVKAQVETLSDTMEDIGYLDSYGLGGSLRIAGSMPSLFSGVLSTEFMTEVSDARDAKTVFKNTLANYEILGGSGSLKLDEMSIIAKAGDVFVRFAGIEGKELITPEMQAVLTKYNNTWLAMTEKDILDSMSGGTEEEIMSYQISQALTQMSLEDIEKYLTTYPIWKEIKSVGMSGSLHQYEVELAKENVIAIAKDFSKKATGKDLSAETLKSLTDNLSTISLK